MSISWQKEQEQEQEQLSLDPKICPHCNEPNKPTSKFCSNCQRVLTFDAFNESIKEAEESKTEREEIKAQLKILQANTSNLFKILIWQEKRMILTVHS
jgi:predicted amidophosphoribosyltransferase